MTKANSNGCKWPTTRKKNERSYSYSFSNDFDVQSDFGNILKHIFKKFFEIFKNVFKGFTCLKTFSYMIIDDDDSACCIHIIVYTMSSKAASAIRPPGRPSRLARPPCMAESLVSNSKDFVP